MHLLKEEKVCELYSKDSSKLTLWLKIQKDQISDCKDTQKFCRNKNFYHPTSMLDLRRHVMLMEKMVRTEVKAKRLDVDSQVAFEK